jgi:HIRAN domain.
MSDIPSLSLAVVGVRHANADRAKSNRRFEILLCKPGDLVELRPEPHNRHDSRAVAVFSERGVQIGYLTAERCGRIGALMREGREVRAIFQAEASFGAWIRAAFDGDDPVLPPSASTLPLETGMAEPDFYPDDEWPDAGDGIACE